MDSQIAQYETVLRDFESSTYPIVDRPQVVAHATLSALAHHWPAHATPLMDVLLEATARIKQEESRRWEIQRRVAFVKLEVLLGKTEFATLGAHWFETPKPDYLAELEPEAAL